MREASGPWTNSARRGPEWNRPKLERAASSSMVYDPARMTVDSDRIKMTERVGDVTKGMKLHLVRQDGKVIGYVRGQALGGRDTWEHDTKLQHPYDIDGKKLPLASDHRSATFVIAAANNRKLRRKMREARSRDDDHFYGAWHSGSGGRGGPKNAKQAAALGKKTGKSKQDLQQFDDDDLVMRLADGNGGNKWYGPWPKDHEMAKYAVRWGDKAAVKKQLDSEKPPKLTAAEKRAAALANAKTPTEEQMNKWFGEDWRSSDAVGKAGIRRYSEDRYVAVNTYLREGKVPDYMKYEGATEHVVRDVAALQAAMKPLPADVRVYRGVDGSVFGLKRDYDVERDPYRHMDLVGNEYREKGFMSTTLDPDQTMGGIQMEVLIPKGTKAVWAEPFTTKRGEMELILEPGLKYVVNDADVQMRYTTYDGRGYEASTLKVEVVRG